MFFQTPQPTGRPISKARRRFSIPQNPTSASDLTASYQWSTDLVTYHGDGIENGGTMVSFLPAPDTPVAGTTTVSVTGTPITRMFVSVPVTRN